MTIRARAIGCGGYLPERMVDNVELSRQIDTSDEWIKTRTGIEQRHFAADGELTSDLAIAAAKRALDHAGVAASDVDLLIVATATPDRTFPATATRVQHAIGMTGGFAYDVQAVCAGFVYALTTADALIRTGQAKTAIVIGAETFSRILDWSDRTTCVLFGDGAGAVVLQASESDGAPSDRGLLSARLRSDGSLIDILHVDGGPSLTQTAGFLRMRGKEVFRHAVGKLASVTLEVLEMAGLTSADVDRIVPHQANVRILQATAEKAEIPLDKVISTVAIHGNTSAASIPLALDHAIKAGDVRQGDLLLMPAIGGGMAWGAAALRW